MRCLPAARLPEEALNLSTSGADIAIAVGTVATAALAGGGLLVSLWINSRDRQRADTQAQADRAASAQLATEDRAAARADAERRHIVDLLLELGRQIATQSAYMHAPQGADAAQQIGLLLQALPGECAYTARQKFNVAGNMEVPGAVGEKLKHLDLSSVGANADPRQMQLEIAYDIDRYLTSGYPPDEVWQDVDDLREWQRRRWPRQPGA